MSMLQGNEKQFNSYRLRLARSCRNITKKDLAKLIDVTPLTLTRLEKGENEPKDETVQLLVQALFFPQAFFFEGIEEDQDKEDLNIKDLSFRSKVTIPRKERNAAYSTRGLAYIVDEWLQSNFNLPAINVPDLSNDCDPATASERLRHDWGLGNQPLSNIMKLLESKGIRIFAFSEDSEAIDAFSCWNEGIPYIFLNMSKNAERIRFNLCHELGHLVLHRHIYKSEIIVDIEKEANLFASNFLMPEADIRSYISHGVRIDYLVKAKERWKVSVAALAYRIRQLGLLTEWHYRNMAIEIQKRNYRNQEPNAIKREYSVLWEQIFKMLWQDKMTKEQLAKELNIPYQDFNNLIVGLLNTPDISTIQREGSSHIRHINYS